jgi:hypothetical protein
VGFEDDRPYWQRHYGITHGPPNRPAWRRLGWASVAAIAVVCLIIVIGTLLSS